jgi:ABC-type transport system involved in cytochrome bd biosynthesis fused ATPase/permease subunit
MYLKNIFIENMGAIEKFSLEEKDLIKKDANPKVIIFDESTSSLDTKTEDKLLDALDEYIKDKTVITIAHRETTIDKSDRVVRL